MPLRGRAGRETTSLRRRPGSREARRSVLVVTNGERTEVDYFRALKDEPCAAGVSVKVVFQAGAPDAVVALAVECGRQGLPTHEPRALPVVPAPRTGTTG